MRKAKIFNLRMEANIEEIHCLQGQKKKKEANKYFSNYSLLTGNQKNANEDGKKLFPFVPFLQ